MPDFTDNGGADAVHSQFETTLIPDRYYDSLVDWLIATRELTVMGSQRNRPSSKASTQSYHSCE
jgi:hypothetical protein